MNLDRLRESLARTPSAWRFFQAIRVLEQLLPGRSRVGGFADPTEEVVQFSVPPALTFPPSEIDSLVMPENGEGPARMGVNFMGVTGPQGVLPHDYTLLVADRNRAKDPALGEFLDLFHHRIISLFYRAWRKHHFTVTYGDEEARLGQHVLDLVGVGLPASRKRLKLDDETLIFYAGLLGPQQRSASALEQLIEDFFDVSAEVQQFVGGLYPLTRGDQCALGEEESGSGQLGGGAVVGDAFWDQQAGFRIRLGPLERAQFDSFLPNGHAFERLRSLVRFFTHDQFEVDVQLVLASDDVPGAQLGSTDAAAPALGWSTWVRSQPRERDAEETMLSL